MWRRCAVIRDLTDTELESRKVDGCRFSLYVRRASGRAESGYPRIEFGYCATRVSENYRVTTEAKRVIGRGADVAWLIDGVAVLNDPNYRSMRELMLDVTDDGYWCLYSAGWKWDEYYTYSTAKLAHAPHKETPQ